MPLMTDSKPLVLVVDDDDDIRRLVRLVLCQRFEVLEAASALLAIEQVRERDVEVVLIDVMMPGMTGIQAIPLLKKSARGPLPVLLLTALGHQEHRNEGLAAGADDYLSKPVDRRELELRVQHFVRLRRQENLIRQQLEELSKVTALKDDLTALLVHDLRNPLTAVKSAFQLLERSAQPQDRELFELGKNSLARVMESVGDLLKVRMLEQGKLTLERAPAQLDVVATTVVQVLRTAALDGKVDVELHARGDTTASVDVKLIQRALENLLMNALRHTKERIDIEVVGDTKTIAISVSDRGPGVPDPLKDELFDMFGSLALQKAGGRRGHGLGLYLVRLVADAHGGEVVVRDRAGGGASFVVTLPRESSGSGVRGSPTDSPTG
jgi:two-component system, sensor histidine kinase and response regulator